MVNEAGIDAGDLRSLVRQVLRDVLPSAVGSGGSRGGQAPPGSAPAGSPASVMPSLHEVSETVVDLRDDADLAAFVERVVLLTESPDRREDLRTGRIRFHLAPPPAPVAPPRPAAPPPPPAQAQRRIERGAVTEAQVKDAARAGAGLLLGARAILTPLARDRARVLGVTIEREH